SRSGDPDPGAAGNRKDPRTDEAGGSQRRELATGRGHDLDGGGAVTSDSTGYNPAAWDLTKFPTRRPGDLALTNGSRIGVVGGGPAGSLFSTFVLRAAKRLDLTLTLDLFEPRDFSAKGPVGCNMCGGIISESLVQALAAEGVNLPATVVKRGIDSYVLHVAEGSARIELPRVEKRIAAVHRGGGPRGSDDADWESLDGFLLGLATAEGARLMRKRVEGLEWKDGLPILLPKGGAPVPYDLVVMAVGVNGTPKLVDPRSLVHRPPDTRRTYITELLVGKDFIRSQLGNSMHVFLLDLPRLEFAALIPKDEYVTAVLLGDDIDPVLVESFLESPEVKRCLPPGFRPAKDRCRCSPRINVRGAEPTFVDRLVYIGDCGVSRLYKDGIGAAYRCAKAAATAVIFEGISAKDFRKTYQPICERLERDNRIGTLMFRVARSQQKSPRARRAILRMVGREQASPNRARRMSTILWDIFTGSAPYGEVLFRALNPLFFTRFIWETIMGMLFGSRRGSATPALEAAANVSSIGKDFPDGSVILREGDIANAMYVIQQGKVEVLQQHDGRDVQLAVLGEGDIFGEMALFEGEERCATIRALGHARLLTIDKATFLRKVHEDPSMAFRMLRKMSRRIRDLNAELVELKAGVAPAAGDKEAHGPS
ncbi:MAG TPA: cyclic nucleotide-binding domain-containing protein, partial [Polyangiaceae bacterium]